MRYDLKSFIELDCDNISIIKYKTLEFIKSNVGLEKPQIPWIFLDLKKVLNFVPEFVLYFKQQKLFPRQCACTILYNDLPLHVDAPPIIAKMNFPILNTQGWSNKWYKTDDAILNNLEYKKDPLGFDNLDISKLNIGDLQLQTELNDFENPIIFNSQQLHNVEKTCSAKVPRIMITFTFLNDPWELLK